MDTSSQAPSASATRAHASVGDNNSPDDLAQIWFAGARSFNRSLDAQAAEQERLHHEALAKARQEHEAIRAAAERARERVEIEIARALRVREEAEQREILEKQAELRLIEERKNDELQRQIEEQRLREQERQRRLTLERERQDVQLDIERQKQQEEREAAAAAAAQKAVSEELEQRERDRKTQEATAQATLKSQQAQASAPQVNGRQARLQISTQTESPSLRQAIDSNGTVSQGFTSATATREADHARYLALHKHLKEMRKFVSREFGRTTALKDQLSEWRRTITRCVSQTNKEDKMANKEARENIDRILLQASQISNPSVDVAPCILSTADGTSQAPMYGSGVLLFLLNHFAKAVIHQLTEESAVDTEMADSVGIMTTWLFSKPEYCINGQSLIDVFWAKFHVVCPALFGINGSERSQAGRKRLGWHREDDQWVTDQEHYTRMSGLGAGFSAITLRDFSKSRNRNPAPNRLFWEALARIVNTVPSETQPTQFVLVKNMIERYVPRIISQFGKAGVVALRHTLVEFPKSGPRRKDGTVDPSVTALETLALKMQTDLYFLL